MPHWLVIDLEATTDEGGWPVTEMEIIEIGATLVDRAGRVVARYAPADAPEKLERDLLPLLDAPA